jgi:hypothetical protein
MKPEFGPTRYVLCVHDGAPRRLAAAWLALGVAALIGSGLLAILLVAARTPALQHVIPWRDFFRTALVIHVDLSVLIWFLAFAAVLWSAAGRARAVALGWSAWALCMIGTAVLIVAPFAGEGHPLMNNYVPVLRQDTFYVGLALIAVGFAASAIRAVTTVPFASAPSDGAGALNSGMFLAAAVALVSLAAFAWSAWAMPPGIEGQAHFEMLFWGSGHVLQFAHALLVCVAWLCLADAGGVRIPLSPRLASMLFALTALPALAAPFLYLAHPVASAGHVLGFTELMTYGHLTMLPLSVALVTALWRLGRRIDLGDPLSATLLSSLCLFAAGGVLGFMIRGANVVIPAHYHGSIVGITLAFMGLAYYLLPRLGFGPPRRRLACWQSYVYASGQLLHIAGLAWSGGYGVQRKVAGGAQVLRSLPEVIGMGMMGIGGLIAIIGGVMFIIVCLDRMLRRR